MPFWDTWFADEKKLQGKQYPPYLTPRLIKLIELYEAGQGGNCPLHRRVHPTEYMAIQRYWNSKANTRSFRQEAPKEVQAVEGDDFTTNLCQYMPKVQNHPMPYGYRTTAPCRNYPYWL